LLHEGIGTINVDEVPFILKYINGDLDTKDHWGRTVLNVAVEKANDNDYDWEDHYRLLFDYLFLHGCASMDNDNDHDNDNYNDHDDDDNGDKSISFTDYDIWREDIISSQLTNLKGQRYLHFVCKAGLGLYGIMDILEEDRNAMVTPDDSMMLPFMLAAEGEESDLTVVYEMLQYQPELLEIVKEFSGKRRLML